VQVHPDRLVVSFPNDSDDHDNDDDDDATTTTTTTTESSTSSTFHAAWLWSNDPAAVHASSGQRLRSPLTFFAAQAQIRTARLVTVTVNDSQEQPSPSTTTTIPPPPPPPRGSLHPIGGPYRVDMADRPREDDPANCQRTLLCVTWKTTNTSKSSSSSSTTTSDDDNNHQQQQHNEQQQQHNEQQQQQHNESWYDLDWLGRCRYDDAARRERHAATAVRKEDALHAGYALQTLNYHCLLTAVSNNNDDNEHCDDLHMVDDARFDLLHAVLEEGAALVQGAPDFVVPHHDHQQEHDNNKDDNASTTTRQDTVGVVGRLLSGGSLSHGNLYGEIFHVRSAPHNANNIAYTAHALAPHQDLAYYESPPGLQLLHCVRNAGSNGGGGGASVLIDALAAAEELRRLAPDLFDVLTRCDATFVKQRQGGDMVYRRPHICLSAAERTHVVTSVHWSPPFEGPLVSVPADGVDDYFVAYAAFQRMLDNSLPSEQRLLPMLPRSLEEELCDYANRFTWEYNLSPGEILIFNNQRLLHGRRAFSLTTTQANNSNNSDGDNNNHRHLIGCYTNIDDTLNEYRLLRRQRYPHLKELPHIRNVGNGSSSS